MPRNRDDRDADRASYYEGSARGDRRDADRYESQVDRGRGDAPTRGTNYNDDYSNRHGRRYGISGTDDYQLGTDYGRSPRDHRADEERYYGGERSGGYQDDYPRRGDDDDRGRGRRGGYEGRGPSRSHVRCRDIMTRDVTVATRDTSLQEVAQMMRDEDTGVIPVVERPQNEPTAAERIAEGARLERTRIDSNGTLVGIITDRDIVVRALAEGRDARNVPAEEIMTTDVHTARPNDRVIDAIRKMGDKQVRRIPVIDEGGNLRGIISMADVALETEEDRELADALEEISSGASFWSKIFG